MSQTLADEVKAVQRSHPGWSFQESWDHLMSVKPEIARSTAESNRRQAKLSPAREKEARAQYKHVESIARRLLQRNPGLTMGRALEMTRYALPKVQADIKELLRQPVAAVETGKTFLVQSIESGRQIDFGVDS
jgi:hypothetical protein